MEQPFTHTGFSGAKLTCLSRGDETFVVKRLSRPHDWIMEATDDLEYREATFALVDPALGPTIATPTLGVARDGSGYALLMRDISKDLISPAPLGEDQLRTIIKAIASLHRQAPPRGGVEWCTPRARLTLLTPASAKIAARFAAPVASDIREGWMRFPNLATPAAYEILRSLFVDTQPLLDALNTLPSRFLHGDLKFDNIGVSAEGSVWLLDWAMTMVAPTPIDIGWFMAINSKRIPVPLDDVLDMYADAAELTGEERMQHDGLAVLCGLLLRGWRKALDAEEGDTAELAWWCTHAEAARDLLVHS
jgi:hypothetical protein